VRYVDGLGEWNMNPNEIDFSILLDAAASIKHASTSALTLSDLENIDWNMVSSSVMGVLDPWGQFRDWIAGVLTSFIDIIRRAFETVVAPISDTANRIWTVIQGIPGTLSKILDAINTVVIKPVIDALNWVSTQFPSIVAAVNSLLTSISNFISGIPGVLSSVISDFTGRVTGIFNELMGNVRSGFTWLMDQLSKAPDMIKGLIDRASSTIADLVDRASRGLTGIIDVIGRAAAAVKEAFTAIVGDIVRGVGGIAEYIGRGFSMVRDWLDRAGDWFTEATNALKVLGANMMGFVNAVLQLPERLQYAFSSVIEFFKGVWEALQAFAKNPAGWLKTYIIEPAWTGITDIAGRAFEVFKAIWIRISGAVKYGWDRLMEFSSEVRGAVMSGVQSFVASIVERISTFMDGVKKIGEAAYGRIIEGVTAISGAIEGAAKGFVDGVITPLWRDVAWRGPPTLTAENLARAWVTSFKLSVPLFTFALAMEIPIRATAFITRGIALSMRDLDWKVKVSLAPLGIGMETEFDVARAIGAALYNFSEEMFRHADRFYEPFWLGIGLWYGRYASMLLTYHLRNFIPIEIPTLREMEETFLRAKVADKVPVELGRFGDDIIGAMMGFMKIRGYSDYLIKWTFSEPEEFYSEVKDRFDVARKIPLANVWRIPPPSDLVTMMIRDVIIDPKQFVKVMRSIGYYDDISSLYYLLHFRYPPPERLGEFYWRGVAGILWYDQTLEEEPIREFLKIKWKARKPSELNFDVKTLNDMMLRYMKWHDYAPFAWSTSFPTDKSIIVELTADLPDKVDYRWMMRWGVFEHFSRLGVTMKTSIAEIIDKMRRSMGRETVEEKVSPGISLDVSMLARMLEARGIHPYFSAITAVADAHVALTDEMSLLRTGFIILFREGLTTLNATEKLMSGLFTIKFTTGYIDTETGEPVVFDYMKPVFWLPAERRLLQLRAVMDRAHDLWRDTVRETASGVRRLALKVDDARKILKDYSKNLIDVVSRQVEALTGVKWTPELDEEYIGLWLKYGEILRDVEAKTWIRHYVTRVMAWITYRASYGWVKIEDFKDIVDTFIVKGWLVSEEGEFFKTLIDKVIGMVKRETIPTALTLATMAEYMVIDDKTIEKVFEDQRVVEDYQPLYKKYIQVKPFKSDYKTLLNRARRALVLGAITEDEWRRYVKDAIEKYGFRETEIAIQEALAELDSRIDEAKEYIPPPGTMASMAEYLPEVRKYIREVLSARRVRGVWAEMWTKYIYLRPVYDNVSKWATAMFNLAEQLIIALDQLEEVFKILSTYGWEDLEVAIARKTILAEQVRYSFSHILGTPRDLAYLARYTEKATDYAYMRASQLIDALPVDQKTKDFLKQMWKEYIVNAQADSEIDMYRTELISCYAHGVLDDRGLEQELDYLRKLGVPEMRLALVKRIAQLRRVRYSYQYWY